MIYIQAERIFYNELFHIADPPDRVHCSLQRRGVFRYILTVRIGSFLLRTCLTDGGVNGQRAGSVRTKSPFRQILPITKRHIGIRSSDGHIRPGGIRALSGKKDRQWKSEGE